MKAIYKLNRLSLKELDSAGLLLVLQKEILAKPEIFDADAVFNAATLATFLHRKARRSNRGDMPKTPYIEHPLRNTIRLLRWGCWDQDIIIASLLHDVAEDCENEIISTFLNEDVDDYSPKEKRSVSIDFIADEFGSGVAHIVNAVSNDILPKDVTREQKNKAYAEHVAAVIDQPKVFAVKMSDLVDNATGLYHNNFGGRDDKIINRAVKYLPVIDIVEDTFRKIKTSIPINDDAKDEIEAIFMMTRVRLKSIIEDK